MEQERFRIKSVALDALKNQQRKKRIRRRIFYLALILLICVAFFTVSVIAFFRISEIEVTGSEKYTLQDILPALGFQNGDNLFSFRSGAVEEKLKETFPYIASAEISRTSPTKVTINIIDETPVAYTELYGSYYLLSRDMTVLERLTSAPENTLISLSASAADVCVVGSAIVFEDDRVIPTLTELLDSMESSGILGEIRSIDMTNRFEIEFWYQDRFSVYIGTVDDAEIKTAFLVKIIEKLYDYRGHIDISDTREAAFSKFE